MVQVMVAVSADEEKLEMFNVNHLVNPLLRSKKLEASVSGGTAHSFLIFRIHLGFLCV